MDNIFIKTAEVLNTLYIGFLAVYRGSVVTDKNNVTKEIFSEVYVDVPCRLVKKNDVSFEISAGAVYFLLLTDVACVMRGGDKVAVDWCKKRYEGNVLKNSFSYSAHNETDIEVKEVAGYGGG